MLLGIVAGGGGVNYLPPLVEHFLTTGGGGGGVTSFLHQLLTPAEAPHGLRKIKFQPILNFI
ncbi:hypothetical protein E1630_11610 [Salmonella enterica subsp. enterica serovar Baguida]|nr:hypothetical protein [Salmonella enterica subsp. enterica serovar Baguida]